MLFYFRCRRAGVAVRSTISCPITRVAINYGLILLNDDRGFENMAGAMPEFSLA